MTSTKLYPKLIDPATGDPANPRSEDYIESSRPGKSRAYATTALPPLGWNQGKPDSSRMIGWTVHPKGKPSIVEQHAFAINPQGITRTDTTRNQMFATQAAFYVDDFGPGPTTILLTQLVAHGRASAGGGGSISRATMREDVIRFYDLIYTKATANPGQYDVYFHDNHLWDTITGRTPELVYFPPNGWQLVRNVNLNNVWQLQLTMQTLTSPPAATQQSTSQVPGQPKTKVYVVRQGDTLKKIAAKLAGVNATHQRMLQLEQQIIALTKTYGDDDITKVRTVTVHSSSNAAELVESITAKRYQLVPGEKIILPAG